MNTGNQNGSFANEVYEALRRGGLDQEDFKKLLEPQPELLKTIVGLVRGQLQVECPLNFINLDSYPCSVGDLELVRHERLGSHIARYRNSTIHIGDRVLQFVRTVGCCINDKQFQPQNLVSKFKDVVDVNCEAIDWLFTQPYKVLQRLLPLDNKPVFFLGTVWKVKKPKGSVLVTEPKDGHLFEAETIQQVSDIVVKTQNQPLPTGDWNNEYYRAVLVSIAEYEAYQKLQ